MNDFNIKKITVLIFCIAMVISCGQKRKEIDRVQIAEDYIDALNALDYNQVVELFLDSIRFNEMDHIRTFTKEDYHSLFQWDSVFGPNYKILDLREDGDDLHLKVSKVCDRILFLQQKPFVTHEIMKIKDGAIYSIDVVEYVDFNDSIWADNRARLVSWVETHHPELDGFIYNQTKEGALNYQKAMEFYRNREDSIPVQRKIKQ